MVREMGHYATGHGVPDKGSDDLSSLAPILARAHRISKTNVFATARSVGFSIGREFALRSNPRRFPGVHSELSYLFRRLNLGRVVMHEWTPLVFVAQPDLTGGSVERAFGDGVLEGVLDVRLGRSIFVEHSNVLSKGQCVHENPSYRNEKGVKKN